MSYISINSTQPANMPKATTSGSPLVDARQTQLAKQSEAIAVQTEQSVAQTQKAEATRAQVEEAAKAVNDFLKPINNSLQFQLDEDTGQTVVKGIDTATKDVIRQFPSEEMLSIAKAIDKMKGLLIHQKA